MPLVPSLFKLFAALIGDAVFPFCGARRADDPFGLDVLLGLQFSQSRVQGAFSGDEFMVAERPDFGGDGVAVRGLVFENREDQGSEGVGG